METVRAIVITLPLRTNGQPSTRHWSATAKQISEQHAVVRCSLRARAVRCPWAPPLLVTLTRLSSSRLDSDNVWAAMKHVRDAIAAWLEIDDRHDHLVEYRVEQEKCPRGKYGTRIRIERKG